MLGTSIMHEEDEKYIQRTMHLWDLAEDEDNIKIDIQNNIWN
jgi:hypothetical protein